MILSVKVGFIDKDTQIFHPAGAEVEYSEKRAKEIEARGFGKCIEPKPAKTEKVKEEKVEPKKTTKKK